MSRKRDYPSGRRGLPASAGFALLEVVISMVVVAVMLVVALNTVGASRITQHKTALAGRGRLLAESLVAEILQQGYREPGTTYVFGPEAGEPGSNRMAYDDVDDYSGWAESPPVARDGAALPDSDNWSRAATVVWVDPLDPSQESGTDTGAKRITVVAAFRGVPQATIVAVKTAY